MPSPPGGHDFMVHGTKNDSSQINYGPFNTLNEAKSFGDDMVASDAIESYYITYTDSHGNQVDYDQN